MASLWHHYGSIPGRGTPALLKKAKFPPLKYTPGSGVTGRLQLKSSPLRCLLGKGGKWWNRVEYGGIINLESLFLASNLSRRSI